MPAFHQSAKCALQKKQVSPPRCDKHVISNLKKDPKRTFQKYATIKVRRGVFVFAIGVVYGVSVPPRRCKCEDGLAPRCSHGDDLGFGWKKKRAPLPPKKEREEDSLLWKLRQDQWEGKGGNYDPGVEEEEKRMRW